MNERDSLSHEQRRARRPQSTAKLRRSKDKVLGGVVGGVAEFIDADPKLLRIIFIVAAFLSVGIVAVAYGLLWLMLPKAS